MRLLIAATALALGLPAASGAAEPDYAVIRMSQPVDRPAAEVWKTVGGWCDLGAWMKIDCTVTKGDGGIGSVRSIAGGRVTEVLVGRTDLSYGYAQPPVEGRPYDLYHGYLEARPVTAKTSVLEYTLMYDVSGLPDAAARTADQARRRALFEGALRNMKALAEGK